MRVPKEYHAAMESMLGNLKRGTISIAEAQATIGNYIAEIKAEMGATDLDKAIAMETVLWRHAWKLLLEATNNR